MSDGFVLLYMITCLFVFAIVVLYNLYKTDLQEIVDDKRVNDIIDYYSPTNYSHYTEIKTLRPSYKKDYTKRFYPKRIKKVI